MRAACVSAELHGDSCKKEKTHQDQQPRNLGVSCLKLHHLPREQNNQPLMRQNIVIHLNLKRHPLALLGLHQRKQKGRQPERILCRDDPALRHAAAHGCHDAQLNGAVPETWGRHELCVGAFGRLRRKPPVLGQQRRSEDGADACAEAFAEHGARAARRHRAACRGRRSVKLVVKFRQKRTHILDFSHCVSLNADPCSSRRAIAFHQRSAFSETRCERLGFSHCVSLNADPRNNRRAIAFHQRSAFSETRCEKTYACALICTYFCVNLTASLTERRPLCFTQRRPRAVCGGGALANRTAQVSEVIVARVNREEPMPLQTREEGACRGR